MAKMSGYVYKKFKVEFYMYRLTMYRYISCYKPAALEFVIYRLGIV